MDDEAFTTHAIAIAESNGHSRIDAILDLAATCHTGFNQQVRARLSRNAQSARPIREDAIAEQVRILRLLIEADDVSHVPNALLVLARTPDTRCTRPELYYETRRAFIALHEGRASTIADAIAIVRQQTRQHGRRLTQTTTAHILLLKGLEFDHAIVIDPEQLNTNNLYVALTRGKRSLAIITRAAALQPLA